MNTVLFWEYNSKKNPKTQRHPVLSFSSWAISLLFLLSHPQQPLMWQSGHPHTCANSPCEYLGMGYLWLRTDDKKCQRQFCVTLDFAQLLFSWCHNQRAAFLWTESISWAFCLLTLSSRLLGIHAPLIRLYSGCYCMLIIMAEPKYMPRIIFLKHICSTEDVFAVILIILI